MNHSLYLILYLSKTPLMLVQVTQKPQKINYPSFSSFISSSTLIVRHHDFPMLVTRADKFPISAFLVKKRGGTLSSRRTLYRWQSRNDAHAHSFIVRRSTTDPVELAFLPQRVMNSIFGFLVTLLTKMHVHISFYDYSNTNHRKNISYTDISTGVNQLCLTSVTSPGVLDIGVFLI